MTQTNDQEPPSRRMDKRKSVEKLWRKGEARWRYEGEGESDSDFISKRRSAPRKHQVVRPENERSALVVETGGPSVVLLDGDEEVRARPRRSTTTENRRASLIVIGDRGSYIDGLDGDGVITHIFERDTSLSRTAIQDREHADVIVANVDMLVVVSAATPELLRPGLIDRYIIAAAMGGIEAAVCVNKMDLPDAEDLALVDEIASVYRDVGYPVIYTSCVTGEGMDTLSEVLRDAITAFSGHSGVGKTSLLNRLVPNAHEKTQVLSEQSRRGAHTTTKSILYELPNGGFIADTPGIREFGLFHFEHGELCSYYPEFVRVADNCRFTSCTHTHEPDCAVLQCVDEGSIDPLRYRNYLQILESEQR